MSKDTGTKLIPDALFEREAPRLASIPPSSRCTSRFQVVATAQPVGSILMEWQLVGRVDGLAAAPASRVDGAREQRGRLLDGVQRFHQVRAGGCVMSRRVQIRHLSGIYTYCLVSIPDV